MTGEAGSFHDKAEEATGMTWEEIGWWAERTDFEEQQYAKDRGHCCWAGMVASPGPCVWHSSSGPQS